MAKQSSRRPRLNLGWQPQCLSFTVILKCLCILASFMGSSLVNAPLHADTTARRQTDLHLRVYNSLLKQNHFKHYLPFPLSPACYQY